ncbi:hypothetical protein ABZY68_34150 [Streptomyces sp. NPDC006482]|uniref:hypothetical protein n=1 Tax=Streptomyces sp. NPDC006482 TaxID=3154306 RepID=UPI0033B3C0AA
MTTAHHLATIDALRARGSGNGPDSPMAVLATSEDFRDDDGTRRALAEDQYEAERDGLAALLTARWGPPTALDLWPVLERSLAGDSLAEPWSTLAHHTAELSLRRADGRWIGLGISRWGEELPLQLLAVVTRADPP